MSKYVPMSAEAAFADIESIMGSDESALEKAKKLCYKGTVCYDNDDDIPAAAYYDEALATGVLEDENLYEIQFRCGVSYAEHDGKKSIDMLKKAAEGGSVEGELKRDVVTHNFTAVIDAESFKDTIKSIVIKYDKVESEIPLENALNGKIDYCKVLDIAKTALKDEIGANTTDGIFNREIMVKLVRDRRAPDSPYYWYISFIAGDNGYWALLINPETGDIVSKKN